MVVLPTLTESDLQNIGIASFGIRRKITVIVKNLQQPCEKPCENIPQVRIIYSVLCGIRWLSKYFF